jgi:hypothetical protein
MKDQYIRRSEVDALVKEIVKQTFAEWIGLSTNPPTFLPTTKAAKELELSNDQLLNKVKTGLYRIGKEVQDRRSPESTIPRYFFNIQKCRDRNNTPPEKRKP